MKFAINQSTIMECSTQEFLTACNACGFNGVELRIPKLKEALYWISYKDFTDLLKKYNISVIGLNALENFSLVPKENLDVLRKECEFVAKLCEIVGCTMVVAPVAKWYDVFPSGEKLREISTKRLNFIAEIFNPLGIQVGLEPVGFPQFTIKDLKLSQEIMDKSFAKSMGLVIDVFNLFRGGTKPEELSFLRYPISVMHINDAEDIPIEELNVLYNRTFPGEGVASTAKWVRTALQSDYKGYFSLELFRRELWEMSPLEAARLCREKLDKFAETI